MPQESFLDSLYFNILKKKSYTDDEVFYVTDEDFNVSILKLNYILELETWFVNNKLIVNILKQN